MRSSNASTLIVDSDPSTNEGISQTLNDADIQFGICASPLAAWDVLWTNPQITSVIVRMDDAEAFQLCIRIREVKDAEQLSILAIVNEDSMELASRALEAGANDVLIAPFEARELRMKMKKQSWPPARCRVDRAHAVEASKKSDFPLSTNESSHEVNQAALTGTVVPRFDPGVMKFTYGASESQIAGWLEDETVAKVPLDQILVCPCCEGIPTFRMGCGYCGSAWTKRDTLIHHYACAYIGSESEFKTDGGLECPKCLQTQLVAGSDFEKVPGGLVCADCGEASGQPELIGHCLNCQHRFPAQEARVKSLTAFHVHRVHEVRSVIPRKTSQFRSETEAPFPV